MVCASYRRVDIIQLDSMCKSAHRVDQLYLISPCLKWEWNKCVVIVSLTTCRLDIDALIIVFMLQNSYMVRAFSQ